MLKLCLKGYLMPFVNGSQWLLPTYDAIVTMNVIFCDNTGHNGHSIMVIYIGIVYKMLWRKIEFHMCDEIYKKTFF